MGKTKREKQKEPRGPSLEEQFRPEQMAEQMALGNALQPCIRGTKAPGPPVAVGPREDDGSRMVLLPGLALKVTGWWRRERVKRNGVPVELFLDPATGECVQVDLVATLPRRASQRRAR